MGWCHQLDTSTLSVMATPPRVILLPHQVRGWQIGEPVELAAEVADGSVG